MAQNFKSFEFFTRHRSIEIMMMIGNQLNGFNFVSTDVYKYKHKNLETTRTFRLSSAKMGLLDNIESNITLLK